MPIYVSGNSSSTFTPAPAGTHQAVCVDVVDLGLIETSYGQQHKVTISWQIDEAMENGKRFLASKRYTASLNEKANLRRDLDAWRGKAFTADEAQQFDLETLIGANALISIIHNTDDQGRVWANVQAVMPLAKGMVKMAPLDYIRKKDREPAPAAPVAPPEVVTAPSDDDIPF